MTQNPYAPPQAHVENLATGSMEVRYVGFWLRTLASVVDTILTMACTIPLLLAVYGFAYFEPVEQLLHGPAEFLISWVGPAVAVVAFWVLRQATPGKMIVGARIVSARTGQPISTGQAVGRYLGYFVSMLPLGLGLIWVAFDARKQGWHDKLAGTVVIKR